MKNGKHFEMLVVNDPLRIAGRRRKWRRGGPVQKRRADLLERLLVNGADGGVVRIFFAAVGAFFHAGRVVCAAAAARAARSLNISTLRFIHALERDLAWPATALHTFE